MTDDWSPIADDWSRLWGAASAPARRRLPALARVRAGDRVLDVGCGGGELLADLAAIGATVAGTDPSERMVQLARRAAPAADVRVGGFERMPWPDGCFEVVTAVNALHFADDADAALDEVRRVLVPGGRFAVAEWAPSDLGLLHAALGGEPDDDDDELVELLSDAGLEVMTSEVVEGEWVLSEGDLVDALLLGEEEEVRSRLAPELAAAAERFREGNSYRLRVRFRCVVGSAPLDLAPGGRE